MTWWSSLEDRKVQLRADASNFRGSIRIQNLSGRGGGRGIVATKDIKQGELILVEKAFDIAFADDAGLDHDHEAPTIDVTRKIVFTPTRARHVEGIIAKVMDNISLLSDINPLYAGPGSPVGSTVPTLSVHQLKTDASMDFRYVIDVDKIESVCTFNESVFLFFILV